MRAQRWPARSVVRQGPTRKTRRTLILLIVLLVLAAVTTVSLAFRGLVTDLAVSSARDAVVSTVNAIVKELMLDDDFNPSDLVMLEKNADGSVAAVTTNVAAVNTLAAQVLERAVDRTANHEITVSIPLGNLLGSTLLAGKGPAIPVELIMLSSSVAGFRSELTTAGINQTRHQILLELNVEASVLMPWRTVGTQVNTEILVSETVIVGQVPDSYFNWSDASDQR